MASSGSIVTPVEKVEEERGYMKCTCSSLLLKKGRQNEDSFSFSSALYWPHCSGVEAVVRGGARMGTGGGQAASHPSGIAIILQTECHALQTADKKTVTTVGC